MSSTFNEKCYSLIKKIQKGKITTYKCIAKALGTKAYKAVGNAMHNNPSLYKIPCHRVIKSNGDVGGFVLGKKEKIKLLKSEGIPIKSNKIQNFNKFLFKFQKTSA